MSLSFKSIRSFLMAAALTGSAFTSNAMASADLPVAVLHAETDQNGKIISTSKTDRLYKSIGEAIDKNSRDENNNLIANNSMLSFDHQLILQLFGNSLEQKTVSLTDKTTADSFLYDYGFDDTTDGIKVITIHGENNIVSPDKGFMGSLFNFKHASKAFPGDTDFRVYNTTFTDFANGLYEVNSGNTGIFRNVFLNDVVLKDCGSDTIPAMNYRSDMFHYSVSEGKQIIFGVKASSVIEGLNLGLTDNTNTFFKVGKGDLLCAGNSSKTLATVLHVKDGKFTIAPLNGDESAALTVTSSIVDSGASIQMDSNGGFSGSVGLANAGSLVVKGSDTKTFGNLTNTGLIDLTASTAPVNAINAVVLNISADNNALKFALAGNSSNPQRQDKQGYISAIQATSFTPPTSTNKAIIDVDFNGFAFTKNQEFVLISANDSTAALNLSNFVLNYDDKNYSAALKVTSGSSATSDVKLILAVSAPSTNEQVRFESFENARGGTVTLDEQDLVVTDELINSGTMRVEGAGQSALVAPVGNTFQPKQFANEGTLQIYKGASLQTGALENKLGATVNAAGGLAVEGKFINKGNANLGKVAQS